MRPSGAAGVVNKAMEMTGQHIDHVIAHTGVRWEAPSSQTSNSDGAASVNGGGQACNETNFSQSHRATMLPAVHYTATSHLLPRLLDSSHSSYIFVTGGAGEQRSLMVPGERAIWGLSAGLRKQHEASQCRILEVRANLKVGRPAHERAIDPRSCPLSVEIGEICGGLASSLDPACRGLWELNTLADVEALKAKYPCPDIVPDVAIL